MKGRETKTRRTRARPKSLLEHLNVMNANLIVIRTVILQPFHGKWRVYVCICDIFVNALYLWWTKAMCCRNCNEAKQKRNGIWGKTKTKYMMNERMVWNHTYRMQMACKSVIASDSLSISLSIALAPSLPPISLVIFSILHAFPTDTHFRTSSPIISQFSPLSRALNLFAICMHGFFCAHSRSSICLKSVSGARYNTWKWPALRCYLNLFPPCSKPINYFKLYYRLTHLPWYNSHHPCPTHFSLQLYSPSSQSLSISLARTRFYA